MCTQLNSGAEKPSSIATVSFLFHPFGGFGEIVHLLPHRLARCPETVLPVFLSVKESRPDAGPFPLPLTADNCPDLIGALCIVTDEIGQDTNLETCRFLLPFRES